MGNKAGKLDNATPTGTVGLEWDKRPRSVQWKGGADKDGRVVMIDQRNLPASWPSVERSTVEEVVTDIKTMLVRGAPAIGAAGAYGMALAAIASPAADGAALIEDLVRAKEQLDAARPTAVNLSWATARILELARLLQEKNIAIEQFRSILLQEAEELANDDVRINKRLGDFGATLIQPKKDGTPFNLVHHCNTGALATVDYGTALGVIYSAHHQKKNVHVWVDETRPRLQGARLTAWELTREQVPFHLMADSASGLLMQTNRVDAVVFGADRVAANGDTANKIGTYKLAVVAKENKVPVFACVPTSTIDLSTKQGKDIVIEERGAEEVTHVGGECIAPAGCPVFNPAFDVTPARYLTAIITEEGIAYPPFEKSLVKAKQRAAERMQRDWEERVKKYVPVAEPTGAQPAEQKQEDEAKSDAAEQPVSESVSPAAAASVQPAGEAASEAAADAKSAEPAADATAAPPADSVSAAEPATEDKKEAAPAGDPAAPTVAAQ